MKQSFFAMALFAALTGPAKAQTSQDGWRVEIAGVSDICAFCDAKATEEHAQLLAKIATAKPWIEQELNEISAWVKSLGMSEPALASSGKRVRIVNTKNFKSKKLRAEWSGTSGQYTPGVGLEASFPEFITKAQEGDPPYAGKVLIDNADTLAHELYHAIQDADGNMSHAKTPDDSWHVEGLATAVGMYWTKKTYDSVIVRRGSYSEPMTDPLDPYDQGEFFYLLGRKIYPSSPARYVVELSKQNAADGHRGVKWFDTYLQGKTDGLATIFPEFIARFATTRRSFSKDKDPADPAPMAELAAGARDAVDSDPAQIEQLAARYKDVSMKLTGDWSAVPEEQRVYVAKINLRNSEKADDLRLIVDRLIYPADEAHLEPFYAEAGKRKSPWAVRVTNMARNPVETKPQSTNIFLELDGVALEVPPCVKVGEVAQLRWLSGTPDDQLKTAFSGAHRLTASAGKVSDNLSFQAPGKAGLVEFSVTVDRLGGGTQKVRLGEIRVMPKGCMIRMIAGPAELTYVFGPDFTEFADPGSGMAMYIKDGDIAAWEGGWMPIPGQGKAMILSAINKGVNEMGGGIAGIGERSGSPFPFVMHQMPKIMAQRFSEAGLYFTRYNGQKAKRAPVACADGKSGCTKITFSMDGETVTSVVNSSGLPEVVTFKDQPVKFEYGVFDIRRPPGW